MDYSQPVSMEFSSQEYWNGLPFSSLRYIYTHIHKYIYIHAHKYRFSHSVMSESLQACGLQHTRVPYPSLSLSLLKLMSHPIISSSITPFSSCLQFFPAAGSFPMNQPFASGGQSIGASGSAPILSMNIQS